MSISISEKVELTTYADNIFNNSGQEYLSVELNKVYDIGDSK
jgi:hypothetical protein